MGYLKSKLKRAADRSMRSMKYGTAAAKELSRLPLLPRKLYMQPLLCLPMLMLLCYNDNDYYTIIIISPRIALTSPHPTPPHLFHHSDEQRRRSLPSRSSRRPNVRTRQIHDGRRRRRRNCRNPASKRKGPNPQKSNRILPTLQNRTHERNRKTPQILGNVRSGSKVVCGFCQCRTTHLV